MKLMGTCSSGSLNNLIISKDVQVTRNLNATRAIQIQHAINKFSFKCILKLVILIV